MCSNFLDILDTSFIQPRLPLDDFIKKQHEVICGFIYAFINIIRVIPKAASLGVK